MQTQTMKFKSLVLGILQIIVLAIISMLIYYTEKEIYQISSIFIFGVMGGIIAVLFSGYTIPTKWIFKYRFWFYGILFGIAVFLFSTLTNLTENDSFETFNIIRKLFVGVVVGILVFGSTQYWIYKSIRKNTPFKSAEGEMEILADAARIENEDNTENGRLILTNYRLCFISAKDSKMKFEISFKSSFSDIQISYRLGIPNGIYIDKNATKILIKFPGLWIKEIKKWLPKSTLIF